MNTARMRTIALIAGLAIALPVAGSAVMSWGLIDRAEQIDDIPVAIVNNDEIVSGDRPMAAGRAITDALVHPDDGGTELGWTVTDEQDAAEGLDNGEYLAVLTIPEDFSAAVLSVSGDDPVATELALETDPAASATAALAARTVSETAAATLGREITTAFVSTTVAGVGELSNAVSEAADGADQLADGAASLNDGAGQVDSGTASLADGLDRLSAGAVEVAAGNGRLTAGATSLADGAAELSQGAASVASGATRVSDGASATAAGTQQLADALAQLAASCPVTTPQQYCGAIAEAAQSASTLASSSGQVAAGAATTAAGTQTLSTSSAALAQGTTEVVAGAEVAASGSNEVAAAATEAANGAATLKTGTAELVTGAGEVSAGAEELATGLGEGAAAAPTYTEDEISQLAAVVAQPVTVTTTSADSASGWLPAVIAAIVLWLAAIATLATGSRATSAAALLSPASNRHLTLAMLRTRMAIAVSQRLVVSLVLAAFGFDLASMALFGSVSVLGAITFTAIIAGFRVFFGRWGLVAIAALTVLQISTLSAALPLQTAPSWIAALDPFLPASAFLALAAQLAGSTSGIESVAPVLCLALWALLGAALVFAGIRRDRVLPMTSRVKPLEVGDIPESMAI